MRSQRILGILLLSALLTTSLTTWFVFPVNAATLLVPQQYPTIQEAVNAARAGDTIQVAAGTYYENVVVSTQVIIVGESASTTIVDGGGNDIVFNIQANDVEISQLTIRNGGRRFNGINVYYPYGGALIRNNRIMDNVVGVVLSQSDGNTIESNVLTDNSMYGITISDFSSSNAIRNNTISQSAYGVELSDASSSQVVNNAISNTSYGVYVAYSNNNNVSGNTLFDNSWNVYFAYSNSNIIGNNAVSGGSVGIQVMRSQDNSVINNTVSSSSYGIYLGYCSANTLSGNTASLNDWGIELYNSTGSTIYENLMRDNTWGFYLAENTKGNHLYHNNLINNVKQAFQGLTSSPNTWNTPTTPYQGNFWNDYRGSDTNGDGVGDTYLPWAGVDWYPLISPWGAYSDVAVTNVTTSASMVYVGRIVNVTVTVKNEGTFTETFDVTANYDNFPIGTQSVTNLASGSETTLLFAWNTTGVQPGLNYTISAVASTVPEEINTQNNSYTDGDVKVKLLGDVNNDNVVDIDDLAEVAIAYGTQPGDSLWNPEADLWQDNKIDIDDLIIVARNYGATI